MEGGQKLEGTIQLRPILVNSDLGQYSIHPDKIKAIRFLRRLNADNAEEDVVQRDLPGKSRQEDDDAATRSAWERPRARPDEPHGDRMAHPWEGDHHLG